MLKQTILSLKQSTYRFEQITVSDDSSDDETRNMLKVDFPEIVWVRGPQRGRGANRNNGIRAAHADYTLISDDDILVDRQFVDLSLQQALKSPPGLFFCATTEYGLTILPNALDFLGFSTKEYAPGDPYTTANSHCFILSRTIADQITYDETIEVYGYEEVDFAYRVATGGFPIYCVSGCANVHLAPGHNAPRRLQQHASRLYVALKRHAYVDRRPLVALGFLCAAIPHHIVTCVRTNGSKGLAYALSDLRLAARMLRTFRRRL